ncbi:DUF4192 domain-containing protein, partial [Rhodococcus aerolatus]
MTENTTSPVVISNAVDLVAAVPAVLGFTPERSLVVLSFTGTRLGMGARVDLPRTAEDTAQAAGALAQGLGAASPVAVVLVGDVPATHLVVGALRGVFAEVRDVLTVADFRTGRTVRDEHGTPVGSLPDHRGTDVGLAHAVAGRPAAPSRDTLVAEMAEVQARPEAQSVADTLTDPTARDRALFVAVTDRTARDRWVRIATQSRGEGRARVAALLAAAWYATGDGPRARIAADVAQDIDPANSLAGLVGAGLDSGVPPHVFREVI